jgi:hypothetical protein
VKRYFNFENIVKNIRGVVLQRVEKDFYGEVHFYGRLFDLTIKYSAIKKLKMVRS